MDAEDKIVLREKANGNSLWLSVRFTEFSQSNAYS
jgi:hypothetical protein